MSVLTKLFNFGLAELTFTRISKIKTSFISLISRLIVTL